MLVNLLANGTIDEIAIDRGDLVVERVGEARYRIDITGAETILLWTTRKQRVRALCDRSRGLDGVDAVIPEERIGVSRRRRRHRHQRPRAADPHEEAHRAIA